MSPHPKSTVAYIGLGSNLGDRVVYLSNAVNAIEQLGDSIALSSVFESDPFEVGNESQPTYLNMVMSFRTTLSPQHLLRHLLKIETANGRVRRYRNQSRTLDLDILLFGNEIIETPELAVPHPRMHERAFVMLPLAEINPNLNHPVRSRSMSQIADALPDQKVHKIGTFDNLSAQAKIKIPAAKPAKIRTPRPR